jgi:hypothetical protein
MPGLCTGALTVAHARGYHLVMPASDPANDYLQRLRGWRTKADPDLSLGFLKGQFQREVARPFKQLGVLAELWQQLVPAELVAHTRLEGLSRGALRVVVDSSVRLYELDRLLRAGLERQLLAAAKHAVVRRVQLRIGPLEPPAEAPRGGAPGQ